MPTPNDIKKLSFEKAVRLEKIIDAVEKRIAQSSNDLTKILLKKFLDQLNVEKGKIVSQLNQQTITLFNRAYKEYLETKKRALIKSFLKDITSILDDNYNFYKATNDGFSLDRSIVDNLVNRRLGLGSDGSVIKNGYMNGLLDDASVKSDIQKYVFREMFKGTSYESLAKGLKELIVGDEKRLGVFQKYYRTFSFDVYAQLSRYTSGQYAQKLGLTYFIYNGGLIETSRTFCRKRNGEVFSTQEAEEWIHDPDLTAVANKDSYNWLIDFGGYNCRHYADFIANEIAYVLRPDLRN